MNKAIALSVLILLASIAASAQLCPGSHLNYYVRDAHGKLFDPDTNGLIYEQPGVEANAYTHWDIRPQNSYRNNGIDAPSDIVDFDKKNKSLTIGGMCGFRGPVDLKLTLNGKVMELHFGLPDMGDGTLSANFTVDALPFEPGKFTIDLTKPTSKARYAGPGGYFAAANWKKVE
ncbi:MAG: hypothetical protein ACJ73D_13120 [Pyrinomonadaceae bacterium]